MALVSTRLAPPLLCALLLPGCFNPQGPGAISETTTLGPEASSTTTTTISPGTTSEGMTSIATSSQSTGPVLDSSGGVTGDVSTTDGGTTDAGTTAAESTSTTEPGTSSSEGGSTSTGMVCVPGPAEIEFESLGGFIAQGDAWQSFTADTTGDVVEIDFYWNLSGTNDEFIINVYEGEGTGGMLLHSEMFPGQGMGVFVGFDVNMLSTPIPIEAGSIYTVEGVDTFGWQTANGAIAGSTSSLGVGQHKNIRVWVEPCI